MAENPTSVMPDFAYQWDIKQISSHNTLVRRTPTGREQRFGYYPNSGYPQFVADTTPLSMNDRASLRDFILSVRGKLFSFYWYETMNENFTNLSLGTIAAVSSLIIPYKNIVPTIDTSPALFIVTVAGVSKAFTITENIGTYGEARINFTGGAQTGAVVGTFAARAQRVGRFDLDDATESFMQNSASIRTSVLIKIQGL